MQDKAFGILVWFVVCTLLHLEILEKDRGEGLNSRHPDNEGSSAFLSYSVIRSCTGASQAKLRHLACLSTPSMIQAERVDIYSFVSWFSRVPW
jgi:hypothetical protein